MPLHEPPPGYRRTLPAVSAAPGPGGDALLSLGHGATVTLLGVPATRVAAHLEDYVKLVPDDFGVF